MKNNNFSIILRIGLLVLAVSVLFSVETASASIGNWYKDPFGIREFVNSKALQYGFTPVPVTGQAGALNFDSVTAKKICQLAGYDDAATMDCVSTYDNARCGWYSCQDNVLAKWNPARNNFDIGNACSAGNTWISSLVCKNNPPACTSHVSKNCVGNSVYWFNSCNNQEDLFQACTSNQICQNAQCVNVTCSTNANCGTNGYIGSPFCQNGDVYKYYRTNTCNNPGTANSSCSQSDTAQLQTNCTSNQTCSNGQCQNVNIVCSTNANCGTNGYVGSPFCQGNNVYQNYTTHTCNNPGTANSACSNSTAPQLKTNCTGNQTCTNGSCTDQNNLVVSCYATPNPANTNQSVSFIATVTGGTGSYTYSWSGVCTGSSQVCNKSFSQSGAQTATINVASGSQTNSSICSVNINQNCTNYSYRQCSGNNLYWYDSCGNQQDLIQYCPNGCQNNSCIQQNISVQTNSATNVYSNQATLNGYLSNYNNYNNSAYVWFQWGTSTSYGYETQHQAMSYNGSFSQNITNVYSGTTYHFRAVAQPYNGNTVYGQDIAFTVGGSSGMLTINKTVRNMTSSNSSWSNSIYASPSDMLMFMITIQATGFQNVNNVFVRDAFPINLIYKNQLVVSGSSNYSGDITSGISIGTISAGQTVTITYQVQIASLQNFSYGTTVLNNSVSVTSSNSSSNPTSNASISVTRSAVYGATTVSTGLTNNFLLDSFILPLIIALIGVLMFKAGMFVGVERWMDNRKKNHRNYRAQKDLKARITRIKQAEEN